MDRPKNRSISRSLTASLVLTIVVISLSFIGLNSYLISEREQRWLFEKADETIDTISRTLKVPLWDLDRENIRVICSYYYLNELITTVTLTGVSGETLYDRTKNTGAEGTSLVERSREIHYNGELIGNVRIAMTPKRSQESNRQLLIAAMIGLLITVAGLVVSTGFLLKQFLKTPLEYMRGIVDSYSRGDYDPPQQDIRYLEFEPIVTVLVEMGKTIESQMTALQQAESDLTQYSDRLEKMVARRTRELERTNRDLKREINERKLTEEALREREERLQAILAASPDPMVMYDTEGTPRYINPAFTQVFGWTLEELKGRRIPFVPENHQAFTRQAIRDLYRRGGTKIFETQRYTKHGGILDVMVSAAAMKGPDGRPTGMVVNLTDISKPKQMEAALRDSEKKYRTLFEFSEDALFLGTTAGGEIRFVDCNTRACEMYKCTRAEFIGKTPADISPERQPDGSRNLEGAEASTRRALAGVPQHFYWKHRRFDGTTFDSEITLNRLMIGDEIYLQGIVRDISEKIRTDEEKARLRNQLQHAQKMKAIGTLAGGIAHDFNNLLMGIQGRSSLMLLDTELARDHVDHLKAIEEYIVSATDLTKQLLGFARGGKYNPKPIDLNELVADSSRMFGRARKEIQIHTQFAPQPVVVEADRRQIEQVLLNLYVNAWQAMPDGGDLFLETRVTHLDAADCRPHQIQAGAYAKVSVADTGVGIDPDSLGRVFDPFFTTKETGRGTGLGLASAYGIVNNHAGTITVTSKVGRGTTFDVYLPLTDRPVDREIPSAVTPVRGAETILLVDDEEMIVEIGRKMLEKLGYTVLSESSGKQAVERVRREGERIDLVILDLIMPGIKGDRVFGRIRELFPRMPVLLSSGYAIDGQATEIMNQGCNGFIQKPFSISTLSQKIRTILDETREGSDARG